MATAYVTDEDILAIPGRLRNLWRTLDPEQRTNMIQQACGHVNNFLGQDLAAQTGVVKTFQIDRRRDYLILPNKPVTNISSIIIQPAGEPPFALDSAVQAGPGMPALVPGGPVPTVYLSGGQSFRYKPNNQYPTVPNFDRDTWPFMEEDVAQVTYDCGYAPSAIPAQVTQAARQVLATMIFAVADNPSGAASISSGGTHFMFGGRESVINPAVQEAEDWLMPFRCEVVDS